jgi:nucleoside-diphosphate-sugar epimerase
MKSKVAAVTGGYGMVGSSIVEMLLIDGWHVKILSRSNRNYPSDKVTMVKSDLNSLNGLKSLLENVDAIFHCAAEIKDEKKMFLTNVEGTRKLLKISAQTSATFFCFVSSAGVVSSSVQTFVTEDTICNPKTKYEKTKYQSELLVKNSNLNMSVCILRPTNVVSMLKPGVLILPELNGWKEKLKVRIKGKELAHIVHVKDVANVAMFFLKKKILGVNTFFIAIDDDNDNTVLDIYNTYIKLFNNMSGIKLTMPVYFPYILRVLFRKKSLHGKTAFSNKKLKNYGFCFEYSVRDIVTEVHNKKR